MVLLVVLNIVLFVAYLVNVWKRSTWVIIIFLLYLFNISFTQHQGFLHRFNIQYRVDVLVASHIVTFFSQFALLALVLFLSEWTEHLQEHFASLLNFFLDLLDQLVNSFLFLDAVYSVLTELFFEILITFKAFFHRLTPLHRVVLFDAIAYMLLNDFVDVFDLVMLPFETANA